MASRYDYRDPGQDPEYCNTLAPEPDEPLCKHCGELCDCGEHSHDKHCLGCSICAETGCQAYNGDTCAWCSEPFDTPTHGADYWPYCSSLCATRAAADSEESEV